jgi:hypothetical protein
MVIIYEKSTGDIIASFPETENLSSKITVTRDNKSIADFDTKIIVNKDAVNLENPKHPAHIHDFKVSADKTKVTQFRNKDKYKHPDILLQKRKH